MKQVVKEAKKVVNIDIKTTSMDETFKQVKILVQFRHIEAEKTETDSRFTTVRYPISVYLGEAIGGHKGKAIVPFTIASKTEPDVATFSLKGEAHIQGAPEEIESWIVPKGEEAPRVWKIIYRESVAMLTILAKFINVPSPSASPSGE
jgi:hypothetical protein